MTSIKILVLLVVVDYLILVVAAQVFDALVHNTALEWIAVLVPPPFMFYAAFILIKRWME